MCLTFCIVFLRINKCLLLELFFPVLLLKIVPHLRAVSHIFCNKKNRIRIIPIIYFSTALTPGYVLLDIQEIGPKISKQHLDENQSNFSDLDALGQTSLLNPTKGKISSTQLRNKQNWHELYSKCNSYLDTIFGRFLVLKNIQRKRNSHSDYSTKNYSACLHFWLKIGIFFIEKRRKTWIKYEINSSRSKTRLTSCKYKKTSFSLNLTTLKFIRFFKYSTLESTWGREILGIVNLFRANNYYIPHKKIIFQSFSPWTVNTLRMTEIHAW